jgi:hypothetical protein
MGWHGRPTVPAPTVVSVPGLHPVLVAVVDLVEGRDVPPVHVLAVVVDRVELVGLHAVGALAAVHEVHLAVANAEAVVAVPAAELVAIRVADRLDVEA